MREALLSQLAATNAGDPWYGASRASLLRNVPAAQAAAHPIAGAHSIWELVLHMTSWTNEVRRRLGGSAPADPLEGDWPAQPVAPTAAAWDAAQRSLSHAHAELLTAATALPAARWDDPVGTVRDPALGTGISVGAMLVGLAQHDAYHLGQIGLLRKALDIR